MKRDKIIEKIDKAIEMLETIRIDIALKPKREGIDGQASDLNLLLCQIHDNLTEQPEGVSEEWNKKAPDCVGYWLRMNAIHKPEIHYIYEDYRNPDKALCVTWGWSGEQSTMRIKDNLHKIEHFFWYGPFTIPPKELKE